MRKLILKLLASFFYVGYLPFMPGTFGSLAGLLLFYFARNNPAMQITLTCGLAALGFLASGPAEKVIGRKDSPHIVIDEISGMCISLLFLPYNFTTVLCAFFIFRLLDTLKPYPAYDLESKRGSIGIMSDDIVAGLYTNIILQAVLRFTSFNTL
jgi:phosphatidylglycerophosphatase A